MVARGSELLSNVGEYSVLLSRRDHDGCHWVILSCDSTDMRSFVSVNMASYRSLFGNVMLMTSARTGSLLVPFHPL